jgi:hypothetical protein
MLGATTETSDVVFAIAFSAGGVLIAALVGLWIRARKNRKPKP